MINELIILLLTMPQHGVPERLLHANIAYKSYVKPIPAEDLNPSTSK
jgi:hypothetical protein